MKAIVFRRYGNPDVLRVAQVDRPVPGDNELLIRVHAAEATKGDCEMRSFRFAVNWFWLPLRLAMGIRRPRRQVLGGYFSGVVEQAGNAVTRFRVGDEVFGVSKMLLGAYAEYLCLPADYPLTKKPANLSHVEAAAVPLGGLNALHFMRLANIQPGDAVLINGAGGSIGTYALQIAKNLGAQVTVIDAAHKQTMLRDLGADRFIDYASENFLASAHRYDVIFDMVVGSSYSGCVAMLKDNGRYLMGNPRLSDMLRSVVTSRLTSKKVFFAFARESQEELDSLKQMLEAGTLRPVVDQVFAMDQAGDAHRRVESEQRQGVVVIRMT